MSWWKKLLNQQSEMQADAHAKAMEEPFLYPECGDPPISMEEMVVELAERVANLAERVANLEQIARDMIADS